MENQNNVVKKFGMVDKVGYAFGDLANNLTFVISAVFLLKFYTDVMGISAGLVGLMMMFGKIVDAFTDITMGQIVDRSRPTAKGKFAPWLRRMCGPIAVATVLLFPVWFKNMPMGFKICCGAAYGILRSIFLTDRWHRLYLRNPKIEPLSLHGER